MTLREQRRAPRAEPVVEAEQEVDLGRYWSMIVARWWLPLGGLLAGAVVGYALALSGSQVYQGQATVYLGQPLGILGGSQVQSLNTNPSTAHAIVLSSSVVQQVAHDTGLSTRALRSGTSANAIQGNIAKLGQTPLVTVGVKGPAPAKVRAAANELAQILVSRLAGYAKTKIETLTQNIAVDRTAIDAVDSALGKSGVSSTDKLILQLRLTQLQQDLTQSIQLKALAQDVEAPRIVSRAAAEKVSARSRRNSLAVGAVLGLLIGVVAALLADRLPWRPARRPAL